MNTIYKGIKIAEKTIFENTDLIDYDFTKSDLTEVVFENVNFYNCIFNKTICAATRFWCCFFESCSFTRVDLSDTYLGAWGGGQNNCTFTKCKFGRITNASYITNTTFDNCKIKNCRIDCFYMENVRFSGWINDLMIRKMQKEEIMQYQTSERASQVIKHINEHVKMKNIFDSPKVIMKDIDFSLATMQFLNFEDCDFQNMVPPKNDKHLYIDANLYQITTSVITEIHRYWYNDDNKSWAIHCVENIQKQAPTALVCWYDFKHFESEEFADRLMELFRKAKKESDENLKPSSVAKPSNYA